VKKALPLSKLRRHLSKIETGPQANCKVFFGFFSEYSGFDSGCPGGTLDNSPAIYRWVARLFINLVPEGRLIVVIQPSLRDYHHGLKRPSSKLIIPPGQNA